MYNMRDEGLEKMSKMALPEIKEVHLADIVICYLLDQIEEPVLAEDLFEILVSDEFINFFTYQQALDDLLEQKSVIKNQKNQEVCYAITQEGKEAYQNLTGCLAAPYWERLISSAYQHLITSKSKSRIRIWTEETDNGYFVCASFVDRKQTMMDLKLFAPEKKHADFLKSQIEKNPTQFYRKVIDTAYFNGNNSSQD